MKGNKIFSSKARVKNTDGEYSLCHLGDNVLSNLELFSGKESSQPVSFVDFSQNHVKPTYPWDNLPTLESVINNLCNTCSIFVENMPQFGSVMTEVPKFGPVATTAPSDILRDDLKEEEIIEGLKAIMRKTRNWGIACWYTVHKVFKEYGFYKGKGNVTYKRFIAWVEKHFGWERSSKQFDTTVNRQLKKLSTSEWKEKLVMSKPAKDMYCKLQEDIWRKFTKLDENSPRRFREEYMVSKG